MMLLTPTDVIMDILGNKGMRKMVTAYYEGTGEQKLVSRAIVKAWVREKELSDNLDSGTPLKFDSLRYIDTDMSLTYTHIQCAKVLSTNLIFFQAHSSRFPTHWPYP